MSRIKSRSVRAAVAAGVAVASLSAFAAAPAHAAAPVQSEISDIDVIDGYCGFAGLTVRRTVHLEILDGLHNELDFHHVRFTTVRENVDNGKVLTTTGVNTFAVQRAVDNGDGTYTVYFGETDHYRALDGAGQMLGVTAVHWEWASLYDPATDTFTDLSVREVGTDEVGDLCAAGGMVEQYLI